MMKGREKLVEFLLKAQKEGIPIDRHLIALVENGSINDLKELKANIDKAHAEITVDPFATIRGKLTKSLLHLQSRGLIKDPTIITKVENADLKTLKQIQDNLGKALKITSFTKENVKRLLKLQKEGKLKDPSLITKCEVAGELFFKIFDETLKKKTYKSPAHERFGPKLVEGGHATWDDLNGLADDKVRDLHDEIYPETKTYSRTGGPKGTGFESKTYTKEFKGIKKSTPKPTTLKKQIAKMLPAFMGRATGGVSEGKREAAPIGIEVMTIPLKYRSDYRKLRIGGMEHEEAKETSMSTKRAEPEEHVKQLKENPYGK